MEKFFYQIAGLTVASDYCLDYAFPVQPCLSPDVSIRKMPTESKVYDMIKAHLSDNVGMLYRYSETEAFYGYAKGGFFKVSEGSLIEYQLEPDANPAWVVQTLLCQCFGAIISQRRMIGIHGSVCLWRDRAFIICGESGAGKSTLTANLLKRGAKYMADDTACVEVSDDVVVKSWVPLRKLCLDALERLDYTEEQIVLLSEEAKRGVKEPEVFHLGAEKLHAMFFLKKDDVTDVCCRELQGAEKLKVLTDNFFARGSYGQPMKEPDFVAKVFSFCNQVPIFEVVRPVQGDSADGCVKIVEEKINTLR